MLKENFGDSLDEQQKQELDNILISNEDIFSEPTSTTPFAVHRIHTKDTDSIANPPYRLSPSRKNFLKTDIERMLNIGVIGALHVAKLNISVVC